MWIFGDLSRCSTPTATIPLTRNLFGLRWVYKTNLISRIFIKPNVLHCQPGPSQPGLAPGVNGAPTPPPFFKKKMKKNFKKSSKKRVAVRLSALIFYSCFLLTHIEIQNWIVIVVNANSQSLSTNFSARLNSKWISSQDSGFSLDSRYCREETLYCFKTVWMVSGYQA